MGCEKSHPILASGPICLTVTGCRHYVNMKKRTFDSGPVRPHSVRVAPVRLRHRREITRWALEHRHPLNRDSLAAIVATRVIVADGSICTRWSVDEVDSLLLWGVDNWCRARGASMPVGLTSTLDTYLRYLSANKVLDPRSDPLNSLRRAVAENAAELRAIAKANDCDPSAAATAHPSRMSRTPLAPVLPIG